MEEQHQNMMRARELAKSRSASILNFQFDEEGTDNEAVVLRSQTSLANIDVLTSDKYTELEEEEKVWRKVERLQQLNREEKEKQRAKNHKDAIKRYVKATTTEEKLTGEKKT